MKESEGKNMKLKHMIVMGMLCMTAIITACGTEKKEAADREEMAKNTQKDDVAEQHTEKDIEEETLLPDIYQVPGYELYLNVPDLHQIESGYTEVFYEAGVKYVTFSCIQVEAARNAKEAFEIVYLPFVNSMSGLDIINELGEMTEETMTINGIEVYSFEGLLNCGSNPVYDAYIKGYSFVYEEMPCAIIGVVMDEKQPQEQIAAVKEFVDAMIVTVREER